MAKKQVRSPWQRAIEILTPVGGGVSQAEAEKTRAMLVDYVQWKAGKRRQLMEQLELLPAQDLSDMDDFHRMVATDRLADILYRLANGRPPIKPRSRRRRRSAPTS
jgi:hypothetical protein